MIEWVTHVVDEVESEARRDPEYMELLHRQYRLAQLAWAYGRRNRRR